MLVGQRNGQTIELRLADEVEGLAWDDRHHAPPPSFQALVVEDVREAQQGRRMENRLEPL